MAISARGNAFFSRLKALLTLQRFNHTVAKVEPQAQLYADLDSDSVSEQGKIGISKWRKMDSRTLGINLSMISPPTWVVLKVLQSQGFEAYLVGGCVRDLLLHRIPKDFDVITTAELKQIKKQFHRAEIVGRRFPICLVHVKGSIIEVSSFETVAKHAKEKESFVFSQMPSGYDKKDLVRWKNSLHRDFTINSLFFDPFVKKVYDYANGMMDLRSLKLRTLVPPQLSFKEDCARILRGLRIAARLGLSFSKETESAIHKLSSSILSLDKMRIMMELNYMLSYGAAEPSLCLLKRFNLLEILLPFHAAYLAQQASKQFSESSVMLMKLFSNMDKIVACDRPSDCSLWVGLLAFHLALVNNPQDALVVWTFASVLYHGEWKEGVKFARAHARAPFGFEPEISEACDIMSDDELAESVSRLASLTRDSIDALTETDSLLQTMARFPDLQCSGLVFVSKKTAHSVTQLFGMLVRDPESCKKGRNSFEINYFLLGKGNVTETRFVFGKVILDTMNGGVIHGSEIVEEEKDHLHAFDREHKEEVFEKNLEIEHIVGSKEKIRIIPPSIAEGKRQKAKKQKSIEEKCNIREEGIAKKEKKIIETSSEETANKKQEIKENKKCTLQDKVTKKQQKTGISELPPEERNVVKENALERREIQLPPQEKKQVDKKHLNVEEKQQKIGMCQLPREEVNVLNRKESRFPPKEGSEKRQKVDEKHLNLDEKHHHHLRWEDITDNLQKAKRYEQEERIKKKEKTSKKKEHLHQNEGFTEKSEKIKQEVIKEKHNRPLLSSLFK